MNAGVIGCAERHRLKARVGAWIGAAAAAATFGLIAASSAAAASHVCSIPNGLGHHGPAYCSYDSSAPLVRWVAPTAPVAGAHGYNGYNFDVGYWFVFVDGTCVAGVQFDSPWDLGCWRHGAAGYVPLGSGMHHVELYAGMCLAYVPFYGCAAGSPLPAEAQDF